LKNISKNFLSENKKNTKKGKKTNGQKIDGTDGSVARKLAAPVKGRIPNIQYLTLTFSITFC